MSEKYFEIKPPPGVKNGRTWGLGPKFGGAKAQQSPVVFSIQFKTVLLDRCCWCSTPLEVFIISDYSRGFSRPDGRVKNTVL